MPEAEVYERLAALAARNTQRRGRDHASSAPGCTTTTCRRSSTRSRSARSSSLPTRPTSPRSRRARCRRCSSSRPRSRELTGPAGLERGACTRGRRRWPPPPTSRSGATGRSKLRRLARRCTRTSRETLETYSAGYGTEVVEVPLAGGATDAAALEAAVDDDTAAVFLQQPNFLGVGRGPRRRSRRSRSAPARCWSSRWTR